MTKDSNNAQNSNALITIQTGGIVGYWLQKKGSETTKAIFDGYFEQQLSEYEKAHECDDDAWRRDLKKEFVCHFHPYNEKKCMKEYEPLLERMTESDKTKAKNIVNNYLKYARSKRKELYPINHPANRIIEDTFLDAYRHGGPAYECMSWMRTEYNLPFMGSHWHNSAKTEKERLSGSWMSYHEIIIPEFVAEEYEDFDDGVLSNGQLIIEIEGNLKNCQTQEDKIRYIISLLQPFKDFADAFYPKVQIDERERSIKEHEDLIKHWEDVPEDTVDERTGRPMHPKEQIDACSKTIEKYKQDIAYWKKVQNDFYWFAQHGLGAGDYRDYPQEVNDEMCKYLSGWWRCMIQFARRLSSLVLCYGIKLMDVQERCEVYLLDHFTITDYVDQIHITSIEHARKLLDEIEVKKPRNKTVMNDSDFMHLKDYPDNDNLDYYLSENHWNFHVNDILYKNLLVFYEGKEVGAYLDVKCNSIAQPIKDYTPLYGKLFNEAYRLCNTIITIPVPDTKVAQLAYQAATWKFRKIKGDINVAPDVIDLIESYHILGMAFAILTFANDRKAAIDRFLIALSVYKNNGLFFCGFTHCFEEYIKIYEALVFFTMKDSTYLRPGYDYKRQDKYLCKNLPWYEHFVREQEKSKQMADNFNPTYIKEQNNKNCQQFFGPLTNCTFYMPVAPSSANKKPQATKTNKKVEKRINIKPSTLKYYSHGNKDVVAKQRQRVFTIQRKWTEWGWIGSDTKADDFDALFEGMPRHCNLDFKKNTTVLSVFLRELLNYEDTHREKIITKQTGQSATSLVKEQFGKTANFDGSRLTDDDRFRIWATIFLLDTNNPIPTRRGGGGGDDDYDTLEAVLQAIYSNQLRSTKGI